MISKYPKQFQCPADAEKHFLGKDETPDITMDTLQSAQISQEEMSTQTELSLLQPANRVLELLQATSKEEQLQVISHLFCKITQVHYGVCISPDFLQLSLSASKHLQQNKRTNVVYGLAKAIGRMSPNGTDSRLPVKRMPMGLLEFMVNFFNADTYNEVRIYISIYIRISIIQLIAFITILIIIITHDVDPADWTMSS